MEGGISIAEKGIYLEPLYKKSNKTDYDNYQWKYPLPTAYEILSNIFLAWLTPYFNEIIGNQRCVFCHNRSITNQMFYIQQTLEEKWEYNGTIKGKLDVVFSAYQSH
jgi:hypothetical protein